MSSHDPFHSTRWSLLVAARGADEFKARQALDELCSIYWYPLYAYVRRQGHDADTSLDLTQAFFARLLERDDFAAADPHRGKFRAFLLTALRNFLANERDHRTAIKRGGGRAIPSIDVLEGESRYQQLTSTSMTPEQIFEREWAHALLGRVLQRLAAEWREAGKADRWEVLQPYLVGDRVAAYAEAAARLGTTEAAVKTAVHRLRCRYGELLRQEIRQTLGDGEDVGEEIHSLFHALGS